MKKPIFFVLFAVVLVLLPITTSFSAEPAPTPTTTSISNPYSSAMASYIADFIIESGDSREKMEGKKKPRVNHYTLPWGLSNSEKIYSISVVEKDNERSLIIHVRPFFSHPFFSMSIKDVGPTGKFSSFYEGGNLFIENEKLGEEMASETGNPFVLRPEMIEEGQKEYETILSEIIDCIRSLEKETDK